jgi:ABC-type bacteriocin/lantibiotic exporter with double-glycine peptidase domain
MFKIKPYRQRQPGFCGPASLKMILDFYGIEKSEAEIGKICRVREKGGMGILGFKRAAEKFGFKFLSKDKANFADISGFLQKNIPVIVDWFSGDDGHYSVAVRLDKKNIYLADPEFREIKKMPKDIFQRVWFDFPGPYLKNKKDLIIRRMIVFYK